MRKRILPVLLLLCAGAIGIHCVRTTDEVTQPDPESETAVASDLLNTMGRAYEIADQALRTGILSDTSDVDTLNCVTIKKGFDGVDSTLVLDYNLESCETAKTRDGRIYVYWRNGGWRSQGRTARIETKTTTAADEFKVNGDRYNINFSIQTNNFGSGSPIDTLRGAIQTVASATGATSSISFNPIIRTWQAGVSTPGNTSNWVLEYNTLTDSLTGNALGNLPYKMKVRTSIPLRRRVSCEGFTRGIIEVKPSSKGQRTLDYGADVCDNTAVLTADGKQSVVNF